MSDEMTQDEQKTAVAVRAKSALPPEVQAARELARERNAVMTAIRGAVWSKDVSEGQVRAIAHYCQIHRLDPVRHVEVLGGKIYLTAELYRERAAPLIRSGMVKVDEVDLIQADERLDAMAADGDDWAKTEKTRRMRLRIKHGVPEKAEGAAVITIHTRGGSVTGVNWCGRGLRMERKQIWEPNTSGKRVPTGRYEEKDMDPVGGNEAVKTAITRAERRAWRYVCDVMPEYGHQFAELDEAAIPVAKQWTEAIAEEQQQLALTPKPRTLAAPSDYYGETVKQSAGEPLTVTAVQPPTEAQRATAKAMAQGENPYGSFPDPIPVVPQHQPEPVSVVVPDAEPVLTDEEIAAKWEELEAAKADAAKADAALELAPDDEDGF